MIMGDCYYSGGTDDHGMIVTVVVVLRIMGGLLL